MKNFKSFVKQNLQPILLVLCGVLILSGILVFIFGAGNTGGLLKGFLVAFGSTVVILGCAVLFYATTLKNTEEANFFLYDSHNKTNLPVDMLSFETVDKKMTYIMTRLTSNASEVWTTNVFEGHDDVLGEGEFTPLIAYKILYDLSERAGAEIWKLYLSADASIIAAIVGVLELNGDADLGKAFKFLHANAEGDPERTKKFLADNQRYIQNKMLKYVKKNIEKF